MSRYWTHYWTSDTCRYEEERGMVDMVHAASNQFRQRGVTSGATLYVVNVLEGRLRLIGSMIVDRVVDKGVADAHFGEECWDARDHCIARDGTASKVRFDRYIPESVVAELKFITAGGDVVGPVLVDPTARLLDSQTLRGVRELTSDSAARLDRYLRA